MTLSCTLYNNKSFEIIAVVQVGCLDDLDAYKNEDTSYVIGAFVMNESYIGFDGVVHKYTDDQKQNKQNKPHHHATWSNHLMQWIDLRSIDELKGSKWALAKVERNAGEFGLFEWAGHSFDGDEAAQRRINLAVMGAQAALIAGNSSWSIDWTLADNTSLTLSASDMIGVANALGANIAQAHAVARAKRQQIEQAATREELDAL